MNTADFIPEGILLAEISKKSGDMGFKFMSKGEYRAYLHNALMELSMDTLFFEGEKVYEIKGNDCLQLTLPTGAFNIRDIFGYNGSDCAPDGKRNIYFKRNYRNHLSRNDWRNEQDPFQTQHAGGLGLNNSGGISSGDARVHYAGYANGVVYLSNSCANFQKVVVRFNFLGADYDSEPMIPIFFKQAILDYVVVEAISERIAANPIHTGIPAWQFILNRHESKMNKPYTGSWDKAEFRAKNIDKKTRQDMNEYFSRLNT